MSITHFLKKNFLFAVVTQDYVTDVPKVFVINGNSALLKCVIPSIVADFISVESWTDDDDNEFFSNSNYGKWFGIKCLHVNIQVE